MDSKRTSEEMDTSFLEQFVAQPSNQAMYDRFEKEADEITEKGIAYLNRVRDFANKNSKKVVGSGGGGGGENRAPSAPRMQSPPPVLLSGTGNTSPKKRAAIRAGPIVRKVAGKKIPSGKLGIKVVAGVHIGKEVIVQPQTKGAQGRVHCRVGRSEAKEYKVTGLSLPNDFTVSTVHGVIHRVKKQFYFTHLGKKNGNRTEIVSDEGNGKVLDLAETILLENGMTLKLGDSMLQFVF